MPRIHVVTPTLCPGDAVSNDVLGMVDWFRRRGFPADAYAQYIDPALRERALQIGVYDRHMRARDDLLIYHHSVGWEQGVYLYQQTRNRRVLKYHSVTPSRFYWSYHPPYAHSCAEGERQTRLLLRADAELLTADSGFNADELIGMGADPWLCRVIPPIHPLAQLDALAEDEALAERLRGRVNVLFVGRVVPNKGHVHAIRAFAHYYHHLRGRGARLFLVGKQDERLKRYTDELSHEVARHHLDGAVEFPGSVSPRQLKTYFGHAAVFLCTSLHEGFCVPLAEAMCYQVPIVAYNGGAVGWTLGKAGLVWDRLDPALFGESIRRVVEDSRVRDALIRSQRRRYFQHFTPEAIERCFEMTMAPLLRGVRVRRAV